MSVLPIVVGRRDGTEDHRLDLLPVREVRAGLASRPAAFEERFRDAAAVMHPVALEFLDHAAGGVPPTGAEAPS